MITSYINSGEIKRLSALHPNFGLAFFEIKKLLEENAADGKYVIKGDELFINVMTYENHIESECCFEAHRNYVDIQMVMEGEEAIGFANAHDLTVTTPYTEDYELYAMIDKPYDKVIMSAGKIAIILPPEPHAPGIALGTPSRVRKMVAKVRI